MNEVNLRKESWGEIAVELARRAAYLNLKFDTKKLISEASKTRFIPYQALKRNCDAEPSAEAPDWTWVYYPMLRRLLAKTAHDHPAPAAIVTIGQFHRRGAEVASRRWLNFVAEDVDDKGLTAVVHLASLLAINQVEVAPTRTQFSSYVILTTDLVEKLSEAHFGATSHEQSQLLEPLALFLAVRPAAPGGVLSRIGLSIPAFGTLTDSHRPSELEGIEFEKGDEYQAVFPAEDKQQVGKPPRCEWRDNNGCRYKNADGNCLWASAYQKELDRRIESVSLPSFAKDVPKAIISIFQSLDEKRIKRGLLWLGDICRSADAEAVMAIPAWLPPDRKEDHTHSGGGIQTGTLVIYARNCFPWDQFYDLVSAFHSGGLMYLGKAEHQRLRELEKYKQMIAVVSEPLNNITQALADMQRDAQKVRAALYDPGKAIFQAHSLIGALYEDGRRYFICGNEDLPVILAHKPERYTLQTPPDADQENSEFKSKLSGKCVLAEALLTIFGRQKVLKASPTYTKALLRAKAELFVIAGDDAFAELAEDVVWLCSEGLSNDKATLMNLVEDPVAPLEQLKKAVHYPFKVELSSWDGWPFLLALRRFLAEIAAFSVNSEQGIEAAKESLTIDPSHTPATCGSILRFVVDLCLAELESGARPLKRFRLEGTRTQTSMALQFVKWPLEATKVASLEGDLERVVNVPRDWRIRETSQGNIFGPFVMLAHGLLGIVSKESGVPGWTRESGSTLGDYREILKLKKNGRFFAVQVFAVDTCPSEAEHVRVLWW